jgi:spore coat protein U-like protein
MFKKGMIMNKLVLSVAALLAGLVSLSAHAATQASAFNVVINLTPACAITTAPGTITLAYTAGGAAVTSNTSFQLQCSKTLPYTVLVNTNAAATTGLYSPPAAPNTGLLYTLALNSSATTPAFPGADIPVASADGLVDTWYIFANIAAGQFGLNGTNTDTIGWNAIVKY